MSDEFRVREILQRVKVISPLVSSYYAIWLRHEIEKGIKENPNNINEVPIQSNKFGGNVVLSNNRLIAVPQRGQITNDQYAYYNVNTMETSHSEVQPVKQLSMVQISTVYYFRVGSESWSRIEVISKL
jgi:hypothetical protein